MDVANRLLAEAAPDVVPCRSVRVDGRAPVVLPAASDDEMVAEVKRLAGDLAGTWSSVGIVAPVRLQQEFKGLGDTVTVVPPDQAKGLEFDAVLVVEPTEISHHSAGARGLRLLYVALTRAVQELVIVHAQPMPELLGLDQKA
jgi:DNA helicase IV